MAVDYLNQNNVKYRLTVNDIVWGLFNGPELELGSESGSNVDPEFGTYSTGGRKLGGEVTLTRPWRRARDLAFAAQGDNQRGYAPIQVGLIEFDDSGVEVRTIVQKTGTLTGIAYPASDVTSSDATEFQVMLEVNP